MNDMRIEDLLPFYALDALTDEERIFVEAYLAEHPEAEAELADLQLAVDALAFAPEPQTPSPMMKTELMMRVAADAAAATAAPADIAQKTAVLQEESPTSAPSAAATPTHARPQPRASWFDALSTWWQRWSAPAAGLSVAVAALALIWGVTLLGQIGSLESDLTQLNGEVAVLQSDAAQLQSEVATLQTTNSALLTENEVLETSYEQLQQELENQTRLLAVYQSPTVMRFAIAGTEFQEGASGQFVVDPASNTALLSVSNLQPLGAAQTYQFWLIGDDGPVSAGLLPVDATGEGVLVLDSAEIDLFSAIGVSIEPAGGSEQPTGDIVMLGSL